MEKNVFSAFLEAFLEETLEKPEDVAVMVEVEHSTGTAKVQMKAQCFILPMRDKTKLLPFLESMRAFAEMMQNINRSANQPVEHPLKTLLKEMARGGFVNP